MHPVISYNDTKRKVHISFNDLPFDSELVTRAINFALRSKIGEISIDTDEYDRYITMHGMMSVSSTKKQKTCRK